MDSIMFGECLSFSCLAGYCPSSCCIGWQIAVDEKSYGRFLNISDSALKEDILSNITRGKNGYYFANDKDGRCKMLDDDGLCRIQRMSSERMLCGTCRKYPRLLSCINKQKNLLSMAASCPVIAEGICSRRAVFYLYGSKLKKIYFKDLKNILCSEFKSLCEYVCILKDRRTAAADTHPEWFLLYKAMLLLVDKCVNLMVEFQSFKYPDDGFEYFENEVPLVKVKSDLEKYHSKICSVWLADRNIRDINKDVYKTEEWTGLAANYWEYRQFTRYLECADEAACERDIQVVGELLLMYTVGFSRYISGRKCDIKAWSEQVAWVYRFCAHGLKMAGKIHDFFVEYEGEMLDGFCAVID